MTEGGLDSLPFRLQASSLETTIRNIPIFSAWAIKEFVIVSPHKAP